MPPTYLALFASLTSNWAAANLQSNTEVICAKIQEAQLLGEYTHVKFVTYSTNYKFHVHKA